MVCVFFMSECSYDDLLRLASVGEFLGDPLGVLVLGWARQMMQYGSDRPAIAMDIMYRL